ncbi:MAG: disulfide bond formation protein B [Minwuia sp.]|nr:disulfide bond formation protein B [Minwuia sp.]
MNETIKPRRDNDVVARLSGSVHGSSMRSVLTYLAARPAIAIVVPPAIALGMAMLAQYGFALPPCPLCVWQRWPYVVAIALGLVAFAMPRGGAALLLLAAVAFATSAGVGMFHAGVEQGLWKGLESCSAISTPDTLADLKAQIMGAQPARCDQIPFAFLGLSIAGWNAVFGTLAAILMLYLAALRIRSN